MGFSLVGNSGDQKTTNNVYETNNTASINPQADLTGAGAGASALQFAPNVQGSTGTDISADLSSNYAPVSITTTGDVLGDSALQAIQAIDSAQVQGTTGNTTAVATGTTLSSLFSGNTLYWILGALVVLFLAHKK